MQANMGENLCISGRIRGNGLKYLKTAATATNGDAHPFLTLLLVVLKAPLIFSPFSSSSS